MTVKVIVTGALGRMGTETIKAVLADPEVTLVGAVDTQADGDKLADIVPHCNCKLQIEQDLQQCLDRTRPDVMIDFTIPQSVGANALLAARAGVCPVIGATGMSDHDLAELKNECTQGGIGGAVIPNFSIGAVLLENLAQQAAKHLPLCEIVELHHENKLDAPSGTAKRLKQTIEAITNDKVAVHSVRLPGFVAKHEAIFGAAGETLTLTHNTIDRASFMPGVLLTVHRVVSDSKFYTSLGQLLGL